MKYCPFAFAITLSVFAFSTCCDIDPVSPEPEPGTAIRFSLMAVGQQSRYLGLLGENYGGNPNDFEYTDDTLLLRLVGEDSKGFKVEETFHYVGTVGEWLSYDKDSVYHYYLKVEDDTLRILPSHGNYVNSRIFAYNISMIGLPLADYVSPKIGIVGWTTDQGYCECRRIGYAEDYALFGKVYPHLNVLVDNTPMQFDGNGETYVYARTKGIVRHATYSWWTQKGIGWDLLP